jgi:hypothetical protein
MQSSNLFRYSVSHSEISCALRCPCRGDVRPVEVVQRSVRDNVQNTPTFFRTGAAVDEFGKRQLHDTGQVAVPRQLRAPGANF